ncbi:MAG TPA: helical backbone metal receptor [Anaeromyxobacteraceae bacterium]|nr:helical backbone metal receptor [Anaeromyxobacteraceae bacterium]
MRTLILALAAATGLPPMAGTLGAHASAAAPDAPRAPEWLGPPPPAAPRRVVSLAPSLTDTVVAMGEGARLVGVTRYDDAPEVRSLPRVGGFLDPSPEAVLALRPDLVLWLTDGGAFPAVKRIADLGVPVRAIPVVTVGDVFACARLAGQALGNPSAGERLARSLEEAVASAARRARDLPRVRVLMVIGRDPLVVAGPGSYPDSLLAIAGGVNVAGAGRPWAVYSLEKAAAANPDLVVDAAVLEPAEGISRLSAIPAVRAGRVARLRNDDALRPGPRLAGALEDLLAALHPESHR